MILFPSAYPLSAGPALAQFSAPGAAQLAAPRPRARFRFFQPAGDAALLLDYANGGLSAQVSSRNNGTGVALLKIYDATAVSPPARAHH